MNRLCITLCLCALSGMINARSLDTLDIPSVVLNSFQTKYRNARKVEWEFKHGYYEVEFKIGKRAHEIKYGKRGNILYFEEELTVTRLPTPVQHAIKTHYKGYTVSEAKKKDNGRVNYEVELKKINSKEHEVLFSANGKVLKDEID